ncbi:MAG TPA: radical SAM protein [Desulfuromonadaceae bacterium]|jgi:radical SAM superfamily enzyme YgiQ (UPF0313 family)
MRWTYQQKQRAVLAGEINLNPQKNLRGGRLNICLAYPNRYQTGMSSLGFQTVYSLLASSSGVVCERVFLPDREALEEHRHRGTPLLSLENNRPLSDFDVIAFSTSFEPDYLNIPLMLKLGRIPIRSESRTGSDPLVIAGGAAFFINPEPVADFIDVICVGEGEEIIPELINALMAPAQGRDELLQALSTLPGIYIPLFYHPRYTDGRLAGIDSSPATPKTIKRACATLEQHRPAQSIILTENTEFGDMFLIEVSRGCPRGCRFCTSGFIYSPFRQQRFEQLVAAVDEGLSHRNKIGLVGAAVSDCRDIGRLSRYIVDRGAKVSVSSLRIDRLDPEMVEALVESGHKTIALAPEGGSQRLRDLIHKNLTEEQILAACESLISRDILNLKLYFIIGLPTETAVDLDELIRLVMVIRERVVERAREKGRLGEISLSVNPFIPKPSTPFQWCGMEPLASLEKKVKLLEASFKGLSNVRLKVEGLKDCYFQALLSRGDRRLSELLELMAEGLNLKKAAKACSLNTDWYVEREIATDEPLPWDIIEPTDPGNLLIEYQKAFAGESS